MLRNKIKVLPLAALYLFSFFSLAAHEKEVFKNDAYFVYSCQFQSNDTTVNFLLKLSVVNNNWEGYKIIKYSYYLSLDSLSKNIDFFWEETLATDNKVLFEIHPPRGEFNKYNQLLPFPEIRYDIGINEIWKTKVFLSREWRKLFSPKVWRVRNSYFISSKVHFIYDGEEYEGISVEAKSFSKFGEGTSNYIFNSELGFVTIDNKINEITLTYNLISII